jgi:hypothetical protein
MPLNLPVPQQTETRLKKKKIFLQAMTQNYNIGFACKRAKINRNTYYYWLDHEFLLPTELEQARASYHDNIRQTLWELGVEGVDRPMNDGHGHILLDSSGQPLMQNSKDTRVLLFLAERELPEYRELKNANNPAVQVNVFNPDPSLYIVDHNNQLIPRSNAFIFNTLDYSKEDFLKLRQCIEEIEAGHSVVVESVVPTEADSTPLEIDVPEIN